MKPLFSINPSTGSIIKSFDQHNEKKNRSDYMRRLQSSKNWRNSDIQYKLACLGRLSEILADSKRELHF